MCDGKGGEIGNGRSGSDKGQASVLIPLIPIGCCWPIVLSEQRQCAVLTALCCGAFLTSKLHTCGVFSYPAFGQVLWKMACTVVLSISTRHVYSKPSRHHGRNDEGGNGGGPPAKRASRSFSCRNPAGRPSPVVGHGSLAVKNPHRVTQGNGTRLGLYCGKRGLIF